MIPFFRGKVVGVCGGGDSAIKGAILATNYATKGYIIYHGSTFTRPEPINLQKLSEKPIVETLFEASAIELLGEPLFQGVMIDRKGNGKICLDIEGLFIEIGADPAAAQEMFEKSGQLGVPVILVDGEVVIGFDKSYLERLLS
jgi:thioredoxin reductase (NADPH)